MKSPFPGMDPYIEACGLWGDGMLCAFLGPHGCLTVLTGNLTGPIFKRL